MASLLVPPGSLSPALRLLDYGTPMVVIVYYVATTIFAWCTLKHERKPISKWRRVCMITLGFAITLSYAVLALQSMFMSSAAPDHGLIHAISQTLLWLTLALILLDTKAPIPLVYIGTSALNFVLEILIGILVFSGVDGVLVPYSLNATQLVILVFLAIFTTLSVLFLVDHDMADADNDERRSLLSKSSTSSINTHVSATYDTVPTGSVSNTSKHTDDNTESVLDSDSDSDSEDEDDKEMRAIQQQRLKTTGGWIGYLKAFNVFTPYLFPTNNIKLQAYLVIMLINILLERMLNVLYPRQLGIIIDKLTYHRQIPWKDILLWAFYELAASGSCGAPAINEMLENRLAAWSRQQLTSASLSHVMDLSMQFHDQKDSGEVIKAIEQAESLNELLRDLLLKIMPAILDVFVALWYVTYLLDIYAFFILIAVGIVFVFATYHITTLITSSRRLSSRREREESKLIYESVGNWFTVSCFNQKRHTLFRLSRAVRNTATATLWNDDLYTYIYAVQELSERLGLLSITFLAAYRIATGMSSVGAFVTLENYWETITWPLYNIGQCYRRINSNLVDAERLLQLFQESPRVKDSPNAQPVKVGLGEVAFNNVEFAYEGREATLRQFNVEAKPGQMVALVGETGSGKSTLFKLLMRFYDVTGGSITVDGHDIRDITLDSLRDCFGFVPQDSILFNMSILENVRYGRLDATDAEIFEACKAASIHDKILSLPKGYASEVGERGVKLSGGERQRIAIARVFLKDAPIVLLDEATSAMDSTTESKIQSALRRLVKGRTTLVIAHRLSTIVEADKILVVDQGQVAESGSHEELLQAKGKYFELWSKQAALATS